MAEERRRERPAAAVSQRIGTKAMAVHKSVTCYPDFLQRDTARSPPPKVSNRHSGFLRGCLPRLFTKGVNAPCAESTAH